MKFKNVFPRSTRLSSFFVRNFFFRLWASNFKNNFSKPIPTSGPQIRKTLAEGLDASKKFIRGFQECLGRITEDSQNSGGFTGVSWGFFGIHMDYWGSWDSQGHQRMYEDSLRFCGESSDFCGTLPQSLGILEGSPGFFKTSTRRGVNNSEKSFTKLLKS